MQIEPEEEQLISEAYIYKLCQCYGSTVEDSM